MSSQAQMVFNPSSKMSSPESESQDTSGWAYQGLKHRGEEAIKAALKE